MKVGDLGFDLSDGMPHLIDLRFADDILLFARSAMEVRKLLDSLVAELSEVGLLLNAGKTVILTSQSQLQSINQTCMPVGSPFGCRRSSETYLICTRLYKHQEPPQTHNVNFFDFDFTPACLSAAHLGRRM